MTFLIYNNSSCSFTIRLSHLYVPFLFPFVLQDCNVPEILIVISVEFVGRKNQHSLPSQQYYVLQSKISLPKGVDEIFWRVKSSNQELNDLYLYRNHSIHSRIWDADFNDDTERTTAWLASIKMCEQVSCTKSLQCFC